MTAAVVVVLGGFLAWIVRPRVQTVRRGPNAVVVAVQQATHLTIDPTRRYFEHALGWANWYVGPLTLTLAILGAAHATRAFVRGTLPTPALVAALVLGPSALLYLWRPSITPDQIWATRRFVPAVLPIIVLAAFGVLCVIASRSDAFVPIGSAAIRRGVAIGVAVLAIAYPLYAIRAVPRMTQQRGFPTAVAEVCRVVGSDGAIVVPQEPQKTWFYDPQTFRSFCNVPVAVMLSGQRTQFAPHIQSGRLDPVALRTLSREWARQGRKLFIVAASAQTIQALFPGRNLRIGPPAKNVHQLVQTLVTRPGRYQEERVTFAIAPVPQQP